MRNRDKAFPAVSDSLLQILGLLWCFLSVGLRHTIYLFPDDILQEIKVFIPNLRLAELYFSEYLSENKTQVFDGNSNHVTSPKNSNL